MNKTSMIIGSWCIGIYYSYCAPIKLILEFTICLYDTSSSSRRLCQSSDINFPIIVMTYGLNICASSPHVPQVLSCYKYSSSHEKEIRKGD